MNDWAAEAKAVLFARKLANIRNYLENIAKLENAPIDEIPNSRLKQLEIDSAIWNADHGDVAPLIRILSDIVGQDMTPYLKANLPHGHKKPNPRTARKTSAARDFRFLKTYFKGKDVGPDEDALLQIVADRHNVNVAEVRDRLKKRLTAE